MKRGLSDLAELWRAVVIGFSITAAIAQPGEAADLEGVNFADQYRTGDVAMELNCVGLLRYRILIKAYVAALYLGDGVTARDVFADVPKRLELSYFWSIKGSDFGQAGDQILAQNIDSETLAALRPRLNQINALYADVKPGDRYSLTYVPGRGTELALNGHRRGVIDGADFAAAYFRIWLGDHPIDTRLRDQLLNCPAEPVSGQGSSINGSALNSVFSASNSGRGDMWTPGRR